MDRKYHPQGDIMHKIRTEERKPVDRLVMIMFNCKLSVLESDGAGSLRCIGCKLRPACDVLYRSLFKEYQE